MPEAANDNEENWFGTGMHIEMLSRHIAESGLSPTPRWLAKDLIECLTPKEGLA